MICMNKINLLVARSSCPHYSSNKIIFVSRIILFVSMILISSFAISSEFAAEVIEYFPASGQWVNTTDFNNPQKALGAPVGLSLDAPDNTSIVSLGAFGGRIVLKFDHTVMDDPRNSMGLDAIVFGNGFWKLINPHWRWQEPGNIEISRDVNGNGIADDIWYLIPGSHTQYPSLNPTDISYHRTDPAYLPEEKSHYPSPTYFPNYPDFVTFNHFIVPDEIAGNYENPNYGISDDETVWGYCDLSPTAPDVVGDGAIYLIPDNPYKVGLIVESGGGDAFDIADAIDPLTGEKANLDGFDFIRITSASDVFYSYPFLLEISTEVDAVSDARAFDILRAMWRFEENNPNQLDSSSYGNFGSINGATFIPSGRIGGAYEFDGTNDSMTVGEHFTLDLVDELTIDCWIRLSCMPSEKIETTKDATIIAKGNFDAKQELNYEFLIGADDKLAFRYYKGTMNTITADSPFDMNDIGIWHHVAVIVSRKSAIARLFLDGKCIGTGNISGKLPMNDDNLTVGARLAGTNTENHFPGAIDELRIECIEEPASAIYQRYWAVDGDSDSDGLPDMWEIYYFGDLSQTGTDDFDNDDKNNDEEYGSGTKPNDVLSFFQIISITQTSEGVQIQFKTVKGWKYTILWSNDITGGTWQICGSIIGDGTTMTFVDDGSSNPARDNPNLSAVTKRFYKISAE